MLTVTAMEFQNNFGKYLQEVQSEEEILILKNGKEIARLISNKSALSFLTDSLIGVLQNDYEEKEMYHERIKQHESFD